eukprot:Em0005g1327a
MTTVVNVRDSIPSLPDESHHPKSFAFPKRSFGKTKPVFCSAESQWFDTWPFLHYNEGQDVMFCHTCVTAFKLGRIKSIQVSHIEAVEAVITLPKQTKDVGAQLSIAHKAEKEEARDMLQIILSSVRFLARQRLALRGDGSDVSSNLTQFLHVRAKGNPKMLQWITKKACKHMHHDNQNEMLELMAHQVLRRILDDTHTSPFLAVMVDETRDQSNKEQLTLVLRWVSDDFTVSEEFVGLYYLYLSQSFVVSAYDGCSTMAGARAGVAVKIQELEPRAMFTHCYGHALNLAVNDTITKVPKMKDCLDTCYEIVKLIKFSPKQEAMLSQLKEEMGSDAPGVRTLCPTRKRKVSQRFETGIAPAEFATSPKDENRRVFFECFDLAVMSIRSRFDQKGFKTFSNVEQLLFKTCKGQNYEEELDFVCNFFTNDFNKIELAAELLTLRTLYGTEVAADEKPSVNSINTALLALSTMQRKLLGAVVRLFQLLVTLPATNATSERSFSALRRIKSHLRSTMSQL